MPRLTFAAGVSTTLDLFCGSALLLFLALPAFFLLPALPAFLPEALLAGAGLVITIIGLFIRLAIE